MKNVVTSYQTCYGRAVEADLTALPMSKLPELLPSLQIHQL